MTDTAVNTINILQTYSIIHTRKLKLAHGPSDHCGCHRGRLRTICICHVPLCAVFLCMQPSDIGRGHTSSLSLPDVCRYWPQPCCGQREQLAVWLPVFVSSGWLVLPAKKQHQVTACLCLASHSCVSILSRLTWKLACAVSVAHCSCAGWMLVASSGEPWGQRALFCLKLRWMLSVSRFGSGCSCFTWIQRVMHYPQKCNIDQEMTARSVRGQRGLDRRYCFRDPWGRLADTCSSGKTAAFTASFPYFWLS